MAEEKETVEHVCEEMLNDWALYYYSEGTRKKNGEYSDVCVIETEKVANRILAANKHEIASLYSLIKELAGVAERFVSCKATECETVCGGDEKCIHKKAIALVAKAREVCNA